MNNSVKKILEDNWNLIENKDFDELYKRADVYSNNVTSVLLSVGINPINYFTSVIPQYTFYNGDYSQIDFHISEGITKIGEAAFFGCAFNSITFPSTLVNIDRGAFITSKSKVPITIPESVKTIEGRAFVNCNVINDIIIPETCEYIGEDAFALNPNIESIEVRNSDCELNTNCFAFGNNLVNLKSVTLPAKYKSSIEIRRIFYYKNTLELRKRVKFTWI